MNEVTVGLGQSQKENAEQNIHNLEIATCHIFFYCGLGDSDIEPKDLHSTTILIYLLSLTLVSYAGTHDCKFGESYFAASRPLTFNIIQTGVAASDIVLRQESLTCLARFIGGPIWVFRRIHCGNQEEQPLVLSGSITELADLWGPAWTTDEEESLDLLRVDLERGHIYQPKLTDPYPEQLLQTSEVACHWRPWTETGLCDAKPFPQSARMLIGMDRCFQDDQFSLNVSYP